MFTQDFVHEFEKLFNGAVEKLGRERVAPRYMSYEQAGEYIGVSSEAVRSYVRLGHFPAVQKGGKRWIDREDIDRFMKNNKSYYS